MKRAGDAKRGERRLTPSAGVAQLRCLPVSDQRNSRGRLHRTLVLGDNMHGPAEQHCNRNMGAIELLTLEHRCMPGCHHMQQGVQDRAGGLFKCCIMVAAGCWAWPASALGRRCARFMKSHMPTAHSAQEERRGISMACRYRRPQCRRAHPFASCRRWTVNQDGSLRPSDVEPPWLTCDVTPRTGSEPKAC